MQNDNFFKPNATTELLLNACRMEIESNSEIQSCCDLGTGSGYILLKLAEKFQELTFYGSDIHEPSIIMARHSSRLRNLPIDFRHGNLFEPWKDRLFDLVINDVSGISEKLSLLGGWFKDIPCETGLFGTNLSARVFSNAKHYLTPRGVFVTPFLSLSSKSKFMDELKSNFRHVQLLDRKFFPLPTMNDEEKETVLQLADQNIIEIKNSLGLLFFYVEIYRCSNEF